MDATTEQPSLTRWIRNLAVALWVAAIALSLNLAVTLFSNFDLSSMPRISPEARFADPLAGFHELPIEQQMYGDGEVVVFAGPPATARLSASYTTERIGSRYATDNASEDDRAGEVIARDP